MGAALASALAPDVLELVVVDDGSTDATANVLKRMAESDSHVRVLRADGIGRGPSIDAAFRATSGDFVMNIDADDVVNPSWVRTGSALLRADGRLAAVSARPCYVNDSEPVEWPVSADAGILHDVTGRLADYNPLTHSSALMRREAVEAVGGYDRRRRTHGRRTPRPLP